MDKFGVHGVSRMNEYDSTPSIQFCPDGFERFVAEIEVSISIACEEDDSIRIKSIEGVGNLSE